MKNKIKKSIILLFCIYEIIIAIVYRDQIVGIISQTLVIWLYKVFPSLFIFYIITSLLLSYKSINIIIIILKPLRRILKFESETSFDLYILSMFIGNPSSSVFFKSYLDNNIINNNDYNALLSTSAFINPLFIFSLPIEFNIQIYLYLSNILSSFTLCIIRNRKNKINNKYCYKRFNINFFDKLNELPTLLLKICMMMIIFNLLTFSLKIINITSPIFDFFELGIGTTHIINNYNNSTKFYLLSFLISFNGLSIILQIKSIVNNKIISTFTLIKYRILSGLISLLFYSFFSILHNAHFT